MDSGLSTADGEGLHELRRVLSPSDWRAYHAIRRDTIFAPLLPGHSYDEADADEFRPGHLPHVLIFAGDIVGVVRIDLIDEVQVGLRLIGIRTGSQRQGHGAALLRLAEQIARRTRTPPGGHQRAPDVAAVLSRERLRLRRLEGHRPRPSGLDPRRKRAAAHDRLNRPHHPRGGAPNAPHSRPARPAMQVADRGDGDTFHTSSRLAGASIGAACIRGARGRLSAVARRRGPPVPAGRRRSSPIGRVRKRSRSEFATLRLRRPNAGSPLSRHCPSAASSDGSSCRRARNSSR